MFKSPNGGLLGRFFVMLMTEIWIFLCKIDIFSETISSGRTYFVIWGILQLSLEGESYIVSEVDSERRAKR